MDDRAVIQPGIRAECRRRVRFEPAGNGGDVHIILEEEDRAGDGLFEDERARVTVPYGDPLDAVQGIPNAARKARGAP